MKTQKLEWFGVDNVGDKSIAEECVFSATYCGRRFVAYGSYTDADTYSVDHAPTQQDFDAIASLLDNGYVPATGTQL